MGMADAIPIAYRYSPLDIVALNEFLISSSVYLCASL